jgi:hypothetical protein
MLEFKNLKDLKAANMELHDFLVYLVFEGDENESFEFLFGGNLFIIENLDELSNIKGASNASLLEACDMYDVAEYTDKFAIFALITNNSGGNSYAIPRHIADMCPNVDASIQMHNGE